MIIGAVLIASVVGAGWYFLNPSPSPPSGDFNIANARYLEAGRAIPIAAESVHRLLDFDKFNVTVVASVDTMNKELLVFKRLEKSEEGDAAQIASDAARSAALGINATQAFRDALGKTHVDDAVGARTQLATAVKELDRDAQRWKKL